MYNIQYIHVNDWIFSFRELNKKNLYVRISYINHSMQSRNPVEMTSTHYNHIIFIERLTHSRHLLNKYVKSKIVI